MASTDRPVPAAPAEPLIHDRALAAPAFRTDDDAYAFADALLLAERRGEWPLLRAQVVAGLMALRRRGAPPDTACREALAAFRYERGLEAADRMRAWLDARGLTAADWREGVVRDLARQGRSATTETDASDDDEVVAALRVDLHASDLLAWTLGELARFAAVAPPGTVPPPDALLVAPLPWDALGVPEAWLAARRPRIEALLHGWEAWRADALTPEALERVVERRRLDWVWLSGTWVVHASEDVARELHLCVTADGMALADAAGQAGVAPMRGSLIIDEAPPAVRDALLAAGPGDLIGPIATPAGHWIMTVASKTLPSLDDPATRRRAERLLVEDAAARRVRERVRWA
ncbi:MAG: hypothetical protein NW201_08895 [Gemmatimonadales bacterium]|nr:hypothetical protein [Gemmatimonadales bacterium]